MYTTLTVNKANIFKSTYYFSNDDGQRLGSLKVKGLLKLSAIAETEYHKWKFYNKSFLRNDVGIIDFNTSENIAEFNFGNSSGETFTDQDSEGTKYSVEGKLMMGGEKFMFISKGYFRPEYVWLTGQNEKIIKYKSRGLMGNSTALTVDDAVLSNKQRRLLIYFGLFLIKLRDYDNASNGA